MEVIKNGVSMRENRQLLVATHLCQLLTYVTGFGGLIVPLILWISNKESVLDMDEHGKAIVNFQISVLVYTIVAIPAILLLGLGVLMLIAVGIMAFVLPIINAIKAGNGESPSYPGSIRFIK